MAGKENRLSQKKKSEKRDSEGEAVTAQTFMFRCESTFTTESLKQMLPKGFVRANTDLNGVADLTEEDITTSITCTKGSTTARLVAMTIRAGLERERWVAEIAIPEAFVDGHVKLSRRLPILATPRLPRFRGCKLHRYAIETTIEGIECPSPCLLYTSPSPRDKRQSRMPSSA